MSKEYIEKRNYVFGIPIKKEPVRGYYRKPDVELRSPKLPLKGVICVMVNSENAIEVIRKNEKKSGKETRESREVLKQHAINNAKIKVRTTLFSSYGYKWKTK